MFIIKLKPALIVAGVFLLCIGVGGRLSAQVQSQFPLAGDGTLSDPITVGPGSSIGDILIWDGSQWVMQTLSLSTPLSGTGVPFDPIAIQPGTNIGEVLRWDGSQWVAGSPVMATNPPFTGDGTQGNPLNLLAGNSAGEVLRWDGSQWVPGSPVLATNPPFTGDGTQSNPLNLLAGNSAGEVLRWDGSQWVPGSPVLATDPPFIGDGTAANPLNLHPGTSAGQVLRWDGSQWVPGSPVLATDPPFIGDGTAANPLNLLSGSSAGQVLKWDGSQWIPGTDNSGNDNWGTQVVQHDATLAGDGTSGNQLKIAQQGATLGQGLVWNGSSWIPGNVIQPNISGNVGIGVVNPSEKLEVNGNIKVSGSGNGIIFPDGTTLNTRPLINGSETFGRMGAFTSKLIKAGDNSIVIGEVNNKNIIATDNGDLFINSNGEAYTLVYVTVEGTICDGVTIPCPPPSSIAETLIVLPDIIDHNTIVNGSGSNGNVGIGTASGNTPLEKLHVSNGNVRIDQLNTATGTRLVTADANGVLHSIAYPNDANQVLKGDGTWGTVSGGSADNWGTQVVQIQPRLTGNGTASNPLDIAQNGATAGQVLKWNGTAWVPQNDDNSGADDWGTQVAQTSSTLSGDGTAANPLSIAQQGATNGQVLTWDNTSMSWIPQDTPAPDAWLLTGNTGTNPNTNFIGTTDNNDFVMRTNNTEQVRILATGNVGIGTSSPVAKAHVVHSGIVSTPLQSDGMVVENQQTGGSGQEKNGLRIESNGNWNGGNVGVNISLQDGLTQTGMRTSIPSNNATTKVGSLISLAGAASSASIGSAILVTDNAPSRYGLFVNMAGTPGLLANNAAVFNGGNVGIGTINPAQQLHVVGTTRISTLISGANGALVRSDVNGDLSITNLTGSISDVLRGDGTFGPAGSANAWNLTGNAGTNPSTNFIGTTDNQDWVVRTNNAERIRVMSGGFVGIGAINPVQRLDVNGNINIPDVITGIDQSYRIANFAALRTGLISNRNLYVGIDAGQNTTGTQNSFVGYFAGQNSNTNNTVFVGSQSGQTATGDNNTFVGHISGQNSGAGTNNVYVGQSAGRGATGSQNVLLGRNSGETSTGSQNTFVGTNSGQAAGIGANNVYVGRNAGQAGTGSQNVVIGRNAAPNLSASNSVFVGHNAGGSSASITGNQNIGIGQNAGQALTTGERNTLIGTNAAPLLTSGSFNLVVGANAALNGSNNMRFNTILGMSAGRDLRGISNVFIGQNCGLQMQNSDSNVVIGRWAAQDANGGTGNVIVGHNAGRWNNNQGAGNQGKYNVFIGEGANAVDGINFNCTILGRSAIADPNMRYATAIGSDSRVRSNNAIVFGRTPTIFNGFAEDIALFGYSVIPTGALTNVGGATPFGVNKVHVNGNIVMAGALFTASDERVKKNFGQINNALSILKKLNPITYEFDSTAQLSTCERFKSARNNSISIDSIEEVHHNFVNGKRYGFKAQDVEKILPEAVIKGTDSTLYYVDQTMLIPVLTKALKEQNELVESQQKQLEDLTIRLNNLEKSLSKCCESQNSPKPKKLDSELGNSGAEIVNELAELEQNSPNPFNVNTVIKYYVPTDARFSQIIIIDSQGKVVKTELVQNGYGELMVQANTLNVGIYYYTLMIDGQPFATRSMVITN